MATRTLTGDMEVLLPGDNLVVSNLSFNVSTILPTVVDNMISHGNNGVLHGHTLTVQATGAGNVTVLDSHRLPVAVVAAAGGSKVFTAEGNEVGNRWKVQ